MMAGITSSFITDSAACQPVIILLIIPEEKSEDYIILKKWIIDIIIQQKYTCKTVVSFCSKIVLQLVFLLNIHTDSKASGLGKVHSSELRSLEMAEGSI